MFTTSVGIVCIRITWYARLNYESLGPNAVLVSDPLSVLSRVECAQANPMRLWGAKPRAYCIKS
jgi:hypothetical protein